MKKISVHILLAVLFAGIPSVMAQSTAEDMLRTMSKEVTTLQNEAHRLRVIEIERLKLLNHCVDASCKTGRTQRRQSQLDRVSADYGKAREGERVAHLRLDQYVSDLEKQNAMTPQMRALLPASEEEFVKTEAQIPEVEEAVNFVPGGPTVDVDDPFPPDLDSLELNVYAAFDRVERAPAGVVPLIIQPFYIDANYGLTDRIQLKVEGAILTFTGGNGIPYHAGFDEWITGVKVQAFGREGHFSGGVYPQFGNESGNRFLYLPWLMSYESERRKIAVTANIGYQKGLNRSRDDNPNELAYGVALGKPVSKRISLMGEAFFTKPLNGDNRTTEKLFDVGVRWMPKFLAKVPGSEFFANVGVNHDVDRLKDLRVRVGIQFTPGASGETGIFGRKKPE